MEKEILYARQPILDRSGNLRGYELLFRNQTSKVCALFESDEKATSAVMTRAFSAMHDNTSHVPMFINFSSPMLPFIPDAGDQSIVIELLENIHYSDEVLSELKKLKDRGFRLAMDDFIFRYKDRSVLSLVDIVKLDVRKASVAKQEKVIRALKKFPVEILAEKVETDRHHQQCMEMGYHYFQGYYFARPEIVSGVRIEADKQTVIELLSEIHKPGITLPQLYNIISHDSALSYKLLRLINSSYYRRATEIKSLKHGIVMLGLENIRNWVSLLALSDLHHSSDSLKMMAFERARFCERLASYSTWPETDEQTAFTTGLFSCLDAFTLVPMEELVSSIPLAEPIRHALTSYRGPYGHILHAVKAHERGLWEKVKWSSLYRLGLSEQAFNQAYEEALGESDALLPVLTQRVV